MTKFYTEHDFQIIPEDFKFNIKFHAERIQHCTTLRGGGGINSLPLSLSTTTSRRCPTTCESRLGIHELHWDLKNRTI